MLNRSGTIELGDGRGPSRLALVDRGLCLFTRVDLRNVDVRGSADYIAMAVSRASPFKHVGFTSVPDDQAACVWMWNADEVQALLPAETRCNFVAEAALALDSDPQDGIYGVSLENGVELRFRSEGRLMQTRFFATSPSEAEVRQFAMSCGSTARPSMPLRVIDGRPYQDHPGGSQERLRPAIKEIEGLARRFGPIAALVVVLTSTMWMVGSIIPLAIARAEVNREVESLRPTSSAILDAIDAFEASRTTAEAFLALRSTRRQDELFDAVAAALRGSDATLVSWSQRADGGFECGIRYSGGDIAGLVIALEATGVFTDVRIDAASGGETWRISARIRPPVTSEAQE